MTKIGFICLIIGIVLMVSAFNQPKEYDIKNKEFYENITD
jgi:hypothetical protein